MGYFASTCPISGLAIEQGDPVRFAFLQKNPSNEQGLWLSQPPDNFKFWTPLFKSKYNEYGSVYWEDIEDQELWETCLNLFRPTLRNLKNFSHNIDISTISNEKLFWAIASEHSLVYDPYREVNENSPRKVRWKAPSYPQQSIYFFMVHEFVFQFVLQNKEFFTKLSTQIEESDLSGQIAEFLKTEAETDADLDIATQGLDLNSEEWREAFRLTINRSNHFPYLDGDSGPFVAHYGFRSLFRELGTFLSNKEKFKQKIEDTVRFTYGLFNIRKPLMPVHTVGSSQMETNQYMIPWLELLLNKAKKQYSEE